MREGILCDDSNWTMTRQKGPFFERKICYERGGDRPRRPVVRDVSLDAIETLASDLPACFCLPKNLGSFAQVPRFSRIRHPET